MSIIFTYSHIFDNDRTVLRLRQPLRWWRKRQFNRHIKEHGCGTGDIADPRYIGGFMHCPEAERLFSRMDYWDSYGGVQG